jgi:hypothetical protein
MRTNLAARALIAVLALGGAGALSPARAADPGNSYWWDGFAVPSMRFTPNAVVEFDSQLAVGGDFSTAGTTLAEHVALWDGAHWTALGGGVPWDVGALVPFAGGLVAGTRVQNTTGPSVMLWDGASWTPLGTGPRGAITALAVYAGELYASGSFTVADGNPAAHIARWDGSQWQAVGSGLNNTVKALAVHTGRLIAGGQFTNVGPSVAAWDGTSWTPLGSGLTPAVSSLVSDGTTLFAAGTLSASGGTPLHAVAKWDGSTWSQVGTNVLSSVGGSLALWNGQLVGGDLGVSGGRLAQLVGTTWVSLLDSFTLSVQLTTWGTRLVAIGATRGVSTDDKMWSYDGSSWRQERQAWGPGMAGLGNYAYAFGTWNGKLIAGGLMFAVADQTQFLSVRGAAAWDGSSWTPLGPGPLSGITEAIHTYLGDLVIGGSLQLSSAPAAPNVLRYDGSAWTPMGNGLGTFNYEAVEALETYGSALVAGGYLHSFTGTEHLAGLARWDGSAWHAFGAPGDSLDEESEVYDLHARGTDLYVGGALQQAGTIPVRNIARWDGTSWHDVGGGINGGVYSLVDYQGDLIAGGGFTEAGGHAVACVARWDGLQWSPLGDNATFINKLLVDSTHLFAVGIFTKPDLSVHHGLAVLEDGHWTALGSGTPASPYSLASYGGDIYIGGIFSYANGKPSAGIARWQGMAQLAGVGPGESVARIALAAPRPNPSRASVRLDFTLSTSAQASLAIHDVAGRLVRTLISGDLPAGAHSVVWDGTDAGSRAASPGLYFARLRTPGARGSVTLVRAGP